MDASSCSAQCQCHSRGSESLRSRKVWEMPHAVSSRNRSASGRDDVLIRMLGLIAATVCLAASAAAPAQPPSKIPRIGVLWQTLPPPPTHPHLPLLLKGLQDLGW